MNEPKQPFGLNATTIKIIAIILMVCDHLYQMFASRGAPVWLTWLGRPVLIMFLFTVVESFHHTRNRKQYLLRILVASWAMMILSVTLETLLPNPQVVLMNNAFSTFFIAGLYMLFWDRLIAALKTHRVGRIITAILLFFVPMITAIPLIILGSMDLSAFPYPRIITVAVMLLPNILIVEGGPMIIVLGLLFYIFRKWRWTQITVLVVFSVLIFLMSKGEASAPWLAVFAAVPMAFYNGEKGQGMKYFFYIFYPAHIYILYIMATVLNG